MDCVNNEVMDNDTSQTSSTAMLPSSLLKKQSPLKHVTPIIKKYNSQRHAKGGKTVKFKSKEKTNNQNSRDLGDCHPPQDQEIDDGMDSLDAALRRAEMCFSSSKNKGPISEFPSEHALEHLVDDIADIVDNIQDGDEEGVSSVGAVCQPTASSGRTPQHRNRSRILKKQNRLKKDLKFALPLTVPDQPFMSDEKSLAYAVSFFQKVKDRLEESEGDRFAEFVKVMSDFGAEIYSVADLYHRVIKIFQGHPDLCEDFLGFLLPHQALKCNRFIEHLTFVEMMAFHRTLEVYFAKQPQQLKKIYATLARLAETPDVSLDAVKHSVLPLLRGNSILVDSFLELIPSEKPPESKMTDFDQLVHAEMDSEHSGEEEVFERVEIPIEKDDFFGGENCRCCCHDDPMEKAYASRSKHCVPCGIKFISGKIFLQTEHGLRPVRIDFGGGGSKTANLKRLRADPRKATGARSRRNCTSSANRTGKAEEIRQTGETDDESVVPLKTKSPRSQRPKTGSKLSRDKPASARPLSLNRNIGNRKPCITKVDNSPPPNIHDQEAMPATEPNENVKPPTLDFSMLSDVLRKDRNQDAAERNSPLLGTIYDREEKPEEKINFCQDVNRTMEVAEDNLEGTQQNDGATYTEREHCKGDIVEDVDVNVSDESSDADLEDSREDGQDTSWTREEDRIILCTFQSESVNTLEKINAKLPHRSIEEIGSRFQILMSLIKKMK